jgi:hypothetical protein
MTATAPKLATTARGALRFSKELVDRFLRVEASEGGQRVPGKPRSTFDVDGSGQRAVTTLVRV